MRLGHLLFLLGCLAIACAHPTSVNGPLPARTLAGTDGASYDLGKAPAAASLRVIFFFSAHCPCQAMHDDRLRSLYAGYHARGVEFLGVDSEAGASLERDRAEAAKRRYPFPILVDPGGSLAHALGAEYATESFVVDRQGIVRYHGGFDSDHTDLRADATPFLRDALDDLLADHPPRVSESKALGCALQTW